MSNFSGIPLMVPDFLNNRKPIKTMKTAIALFAALALVTAASAVEVGKPAPDFAGTDINGKAIKLSDYKGKIVVIESYNSDCPFCQNQYKGAVQELQKQLTDKGVVW